MSERRRLHRLTHQKSISHEDLPHAAWDPRPVQEPYHPRRYSAGDGYSDDEDDEHGQQASTPHCRQKRGSKQKEHIDISPVNPDSFDEMFEYVTRECEILLENKSRSRPPVNLNRQQSAMPHYKKKRPDMIYLKGKRHSTGCHGISWSQDGYSRQRSNTQPDIFIRSDTLQVPSYDGNPKDSRGGRSPLPPRSPMAACMPKSPPESPSVARNRGRFHSSNSEVRRSRERSDSHYIVRPPMEKADAFPDRYLSHMTPNFMDDPDWEVGAMRPRVASLPACSPRNRRNPSMGALRAISDVHRVRSYVISRGSVINQGERYVSTSSVASTESCGASTQSGNSGGATDFHRVILFGTDGVGKRAIIQRFLLPADNNLSNQSFDDDSDKTVSILLDGEESTMEFIDVSDDEMDCYLSNKQADAYVIVYSVEDRESFSGAIDRLYEIRKEDGRSVAVILVANKADLVRTRVVAEEEGRSAAKTYDCKYIEVSAAIEHKVDDLLVGILKQIRLIRQREEKTSRASSKHKGKGDDAAGCLTRARQNVLAKLLRSKKFHSKSCDNLYVL